LSNTFAPSASSARAFSIVRFQTCTVSPRSNILRTKPEPSRPVPKYAITDILRLYPRDGPRTLPFVRPDRRQFRPGPAQLLI